jgi:hypothetical protein
MKKIGFFSIKICNRKFIFITKNLLKVGNKNTIIFFILENIFFLRHQNVYHKLKAVNIKDNIVVKNKLSYTLTTLKSVFLSLDIPGWSWGRIAIWGKNLP